MENQDDDVAGNFVELHELVYSTPDSVFVIQVPRETRMLSDVFVSGILDRLKDVIPPGRKAMIIGNDVNIYEITGADASILKLKGIT